MAKTGYTFAGWSLTAGGAALGASYSPVATTIFHALWSESKHSILFDGNKPTGGSTPPVVGPVDFGSKISVPGNAGELTKDGYTFGGWNSSPDGSGVDYPVGSTITVDGDVTLYAKWILIATHTVLFDGNGSTSGITAVEVSDRPAALAPNGFSRTGYTFSGWSTAPDGAGTSYKDGATYSFASDLVLYAMWAKNLSTPANSGPIVPEGSDDVKATVDGEDDPVKLKLLDGGAGVELSTKTWQIGIQSDKKSVYGIKLPTKIKVYLIRGVNATTSGDGFMAGTIANVYLYSTRTFLGKALVRADGTFAATFPVKATTSLGHHVLQVEGTSWDGKFRTAAVGLTVINKPLGNRLPVSMIFYALNVSDLSAANKAKLDAVIKTQIANNFRKIWIYGYTDIQTGVDNQVLSALRAKKVVAYLRARLPHVVIEYKYFAPANPRNPAHTQAAYAQNRRSEIFGQR